MIMLCYRFYTKYFGSDGIAGTSIATYALKNYKNWEKQLDDWQDPIFNNKYVFHLILVCFEDILTKIIPDNPTIIVCIHELELR